MSSARRWIALILAFAPACGDEVALPALSFVHITAGDNHSCGLEYTSGTYCWGANSDGQLGHGPGPDVTRATPVAGSVTFLQLSAGGAHTCGVTVSDVAYCWGDNSAGQLGDSTTEDRATPTPVRNGTGIKMVAAGFAHTCAARVDGTAVCWGANDAGQLGDSTLAPSTVPVTVVGIDHVERLEAGRNHTCAIRVVLGSSTYPLAYCWGSNEFGQLGDSSTTPRLGAVLVRGVAWANEVYAGDRHSCAAVGQINTPHCWGDNSAGQLGDGTMTPRPGATPVSSIVSGNSPTAGGLFSCMIGTGRQTYCWGDNTSGQLGIGSTSSQTTPAQISGNQVFFTIAAGARHACAVLEGFLVRGPAYCWGDNSSGQLGDGTTTNRLVPVIVVR